MDKADTRAFNEPPRDSPSSAEAAVWAELCRLWSLKVLSPRPGGPCPGPGLAPPQTQPAVPRPAPQARLPAARPPAAPPHRSRAPASALHSAHRTVLLMRAARVLSPRLPRQVPLGTSLVPGLPAASAESPAGSTLLHGLLRWAVSSEATAEPTATIWPQPMATGGGCLAGQPIPDCRKQARPPRAGG